MFRRCGLGRSADEFASSAGHQAHRQNKSRGCAAPDPLAGRLDDPISLFFIRVCAHRHQDAAIRPDRLLCARDQHTRIRPSRETLGSSHIDPTARGGSRHLSRCHRNRGWCLYFSCVAMGALVLSQSPEALAIDRENIGSNLRSDPPNQYGGGRLTAAQTESTNSRKT